MDLRTDAVLDLIGDAMAFVALVRLHDDVEADLRVLGIEELRKGAAGGDGAAILDQQHVADVVAPGQHIAVEMPLVGNLADRGEDLRRIGRAGRQCWTVNRHGRLILEHRSPRVATADGC